MADLSGSTGIGAGTAGSAVVSSLQDALCALALLFRQVTDPPLDHLLNNSLTFFPSSLFATTEQRHARLWTMVIQGMQASSSPSPGDADADAMSSIQAALDALTGPMR